MSSPAINLRQRVSPSAPAVVRARLRLVPRTRLRAPRLPFVTVVSLVSLAGIISLLMFNTSMQQGSFAASTLEREARDLAAREQTLKLELDGLRSPQRVAAEAQRMGMVIGSTPAFLHLNGRVSGAPTAVVADQRLRLVPAARPRPAVLQPRVRYVDPPPAVFAPVAVVPEQVQKSARKSAQKQAQQSSQKSVRKNAQQSR